MSPAARVALVAGLLAGLLSGGDARAEEALPPPMDHRMVFGMALFDQLEARYQPAGEVAAGWDAEGWIGGDYNRLRLRSEGAWASAGGGGEAQALYSRLIAPWWEVQLGVRYDLLLPDVAGRAHAALGIEGTAPYFFDLEATLFVSQAGDLSARLSAIHEQRFTQRLVGQARAEADLALQAVEAFGVERGLAGAELSYRLRYELRRELAPYLGVGWAPEIGGEGGLEGVAGLRVWF